VGLRRGPFDGGAAETFVEVTGIQEVALVGDQLYLYRYDMSGGTQIGRVSRDGGEPTWFSSGNAPRDMIASDSAVFWAQWGEEWNTGRLWRAALDGSAPIALAEGLVSPRALGFDGEQLYFESGNFADCQPTAGPTCVEKRLYRVPIAGGEPELVLATSAGSNPVWQDGGMYWLAGHPRAADLMLLPPNGSAQPIAHVLMDSPPGSSALTSDGEALYWATQSRVVRMPFETREVQRLVTGLQGVGDIAVGADWVYAGEWSTGRILRLPKDGSAYRPETPSISGPCPEPVGSAQELALTPRADHNLELLALEQLEPDSLVVSQSTYERVERDVAAIRALEPSLVPVYYRSGTDGRRIKIQWSEDALAAFHEGQYTAWNCLNEAYRLTDFRTLESETELVFDGIYNVGLVFELYRQLPGVTGGNASWLGADGPTICVSRAGDGYDYVFDDTGGSCGVCEQHLAYHFQTDVTGQVTPVAEWDSTTREPVPTWFTDVCGFRPNVGL
jgi:hypothetical protein